MSACKFSVCERYWKKENPVFVLLLGLCPLLAVTNVFVNGIVMGFCVLVVLVCSNATISFFKRFIHEDIRIPCQILIIASFVTVVKMVVCVYFFSIYRSFGVFLSLIVVNCVILGRAEVVARHSTVWNTVKDSLFLGISFWITLAGVSLIREILGSGTVTLQVAFGDRIVGYVWDMEFVLRLLELNFSEENPKPFIVFALPSGGFFVLGVLTWLFKHFSLRKTKKMEQKLRNSE